MSWQRIKNAELAVALHKELYDVAERHPRARGEPCNLMLDFVSVGFLRGVLEDEAFRRSVHAALKRWDRTVRRAMEGLPS